MTDAIVVEDLTAVELTEAYLARSLSPVEATRLALARIDTLDEHIGAFCLVDRDQALEQAAASEARYRDRAPLGPLDGVPMGVKDVFLTRGWPTRKGSRGSSDAPGEDDVLFLPHHAAELIERTLDIKKGR